MNTLKRQFLKNPETKQLMFTGNSFNDQTILRLSKLVNKTFKNLQQFNITAWGCFSLDGTGLRYLCEELKKAPCLRSLEFNFNLCFKLTDAMLYNLAQGLNRLPHLQDLKLSFARWI